MKKLLLTVGATCVHVAASAAPVTLTFTANLSGRYIESGNTWVDYQGVGTGSITLDFAKVVLLDNSATTKSADVFRGCSQRVVDGVCEGTVGAGQMFISAWSMSVAGKTLQNLANPTFENDSLDLRSNRYSLSSDDNSNTYRNVPGFGSEWTSLAMSSFDLRLITDAIAGKFNLENWSTPDFRDLVGSAVRASNIQQSCWTCQYKDYSFSGTVTSITSLGQAPRVDPQALPEPASAALTLAALCGALVASTRRRKLRA